MSVPIGKLPEFLNKLIGVSADAIKDAFKVTAENITEDMREPGSPITYPVQWDSEKQRKAFFATDGFGNGIPYVRKGDYEKGWTKSELSNGWEISNKHPAGAIGGTIKNAPSLFAAQGASLTTWQSRIHRGRWKSFLQTASEHISKMPKHLAAILKQEAGKLD